MSDKFSAKRIADSVHGTIGVSRLELEIISTPAYQRLRRVKQLSLANLVFPGADYSRFSHSLGVCHLTGRILRALEENGAAVSFDERETQLYRLAGLLHDVGHYPYSHVVEHAIQNYYSAKLFEGEDKATARDGKKDAQFYRHDQVGKEILREDREISRILKEAGFKGEEISSIFLREEPPKLANLISSDLDADRIDYLLRTAHHTGLPYGSVDLAYLLGQLSVDDKQYVCLNEKALHAADHFLLGRYFDYSSVAYHKTVASLELVLQDVVQELIASGSLTSSAEDVLESIRSGAWESYHDDAVWRQIEALATDGKSPLRLKAQSLVLRKPPKLVWQHEYLGMREDGSRTVYKTLRGTITKRLPAWAERFGIEPSRWYLWSKNVPLTKIGSRVPVNYVTDASAKDKDRYDQAIRIRKGTGDSVEIMSCEQSMMSVLADQALYSVRLYVLLDDDTKKVKDDLVAMVEEELREAG